MNPLFRPVCFQRTLRSFLLFAVMVLVAVLGGGCLNLKPQPDQARYYLLPGPVAVPDSAPPSEAGAPPLFLSRAEIPEYLQDLRVATRLDATEVHFGDHHYWAEPLSDGVTRVLRDALAANCGPGRVHPAGFRRPGGSYLEIQVALTRLDLSAEGSALAAARWSILRQPGSEHLAAGESTASRPFESRGEDYRPAVAALGWCVAEVGRDLAERCAEVSRPSR